MGVPTRLRIRRPRRRPIPASPHPDPGPDGRARSKPDPEPDPRRDAHPGADRDPGHARHRDGRAGERAPSRGSRLRSSPCRSSGHLEDAARGVRLVVDLPVGWLVVDDGGGTVNLDAEPRRVVAGRPPADARASAALHPSRSGPVRRRRAGLRRPLRGAAGARRRHRRLGRDRRARRPRDRRRARRAYARVNEISQLPTYLAPGADLEGILPYDTFRVRFQVRNADTLATSLVPRLQYRPARQRCLRRPADGRHGGGAVLPRRGVAPHDSAARGPCQGRTWRRSRFATCARTTPTTPPSDRSPGGGSMGDADAPTLALAGDTYTEVEFTVRASLDLPFGETFQLRLLDEGSSIRGAAVAVVRSGPRPALELSPGQRNGVRVGPPIDVKPAGLSEVDFPLVARPPVAAGWPESGGTPTYRLTVAIPTTPGGGGVARRAVQLAPRPGHDARRRHVRRLSPVAHRPEREPPGPGSAAGRAVLHLPRWLRLEPGHAGAVHESRRARQRRRDRGATTATTPPRRPPCPTPTRWPATTSSAASPTGTASAATATTRTSPRRRPRRSSATAGRSPASRRPCPASPSPTARPARPRPTRS